MPHKTGICHPYSNTVLLGPASNRQKKRALTDPRLYHPPMVFSSQREKGPNRHHNSPVNPYGRDHPFHTVHPRGLQAWGLKSEAEASGPSDLQIIPCHCHLAQAPGSVRFTGHPIVLAFSCWSGDCQPKLTFFFFSCDQTTIFSLLCCTSPSASSQ